MWRYRCVSFAGRHPKTNDSRVTAAQKGAQALSGGHAASHTAGGGCTDSCITTSFVPLWVSWVMLCVGTWPWRGSWWCVLVGKTVPFHPFYTSIIIFWHSEHTWKKALALSTKNNSRPVGKSSSEDEFDWGNVIRLWYGVGFAFGSWRHKYNLHSGLCWMSYLSERTMITSTLRADITNCKFSCHQRCDFEKLV